MDKRTLSLIIRSQTLFSKMEGSTSSLTMVCRVYLGDTIFLLFSLVLPLVGLTSIILEIIISVAGTSKTTNTLTIMLILLEEIELTITTEIRKTPRSFW